MKYKVNRFWLALMGFCQKNLRWSIWKTLIRLCELFYRLFKFFENIGS